jgi:hypothetical protein
MSNLLFKTILTRFTEPSSWAGIGALLATFGVTLPTPTLQAIGYVGAGISGLLAFFLPEK